MQLAELLLTFEHRRQGCWLLIVDQTYCTQQGSKTEGPPSSPWNLFHDS
jgi:hypothetical protein